MEKKPQTLQNHSKVDPAFHYFLLPVGLFLLVVVIRHAIQNWGFLPAVEVLAMLWAIIAVSKIRTYALKVQDRVIRLEERLRMAGLLPEPLKSRAADLTESQIIALRFASDGELPVLVEKALSSKLPSKEIKQSIKTWRPDYWRV